MSSHLDWRNWLYGLFSALIGGGAGAVTSAVSVSIMDPKDFNLMGAKTLQLAGMVFLVNGALSAFFYLKQSPLPSVVNDGAPGPDTIRRVKEVLEKEKPTN